MHDEKTKATPPTLPFKLGISPTNGRYRQEDNDAPAPAPAVLSRQRFLRLGLGALSTLAVLEVTGASIMFLKPRSLEGTFGGPVTVGAVDSFPHGSVTEFPEGRFFLIRAADGGFLAVYSRCPHLGCTVNWEAYNHRFFCPCHASSFDFYGAFETPPVPRALDLFTVRVDKEVVVVDTGQLQQRDHFAPEQLFYA